MSKWLASAWSPLAVVDFAVDTNVLKRLMLQNARLNSRPYGNGLPCDEKTASSNRGLTLRNYEAKDIYMYWISKVKGERFDHFDHLYSVSRELELSTAGSANQDRMWNVKDKGWSRIRQRHQGYQWCDLAPRWITCHSWWLGTSFFGSRCSICIRSRVPSLVIMEDKNFMLNCFKPLEANDYKRLPYEVMGHNTSGWWFPRDVVVVCSDNTPWTWKYYLFSINTSTYLAVRLCIQNILSYDTGWSSIS